MTTPKPYGLDKDADLRWECVSLVAACIPCESPAEIVTTAEILAQYVKGEITVTMGAAPDAEATAANVVSLDGRRPA